jgi:L-threonylcarbamoyladenylate synthase
METVVVHSSEAGAVKRAAAVLREGGLVVFPTDTVYGLAALFDDPAAVTRLYRVKGRASDRPIALLLDHVDRLPLVAVLPDVALPLARHFWPGGLTMVLPKTGRVSEEVSAGPTVGVRVPGLPLTRRLIRAAGGVLAVTSANRSGQPPACTAEEALEQMGGEFEMLVDGGRCCGLPSTVLDCTVWPPVVMRSGAVEEEAIFALLRRAGVL